MGFVGGQRGRHHRWRQTGLQMLLLVVLPLHHVHGAFAVVVLVFGAGAQRRPLRGSGRGGHGAGHHAVDAGGRGHAGRGSGVRFFRGRRTVGGRGRCGGRGGGSGCGRGFRPAAATAAAHEYGRSAAAGRGGRGRGHVVDEQAAGPALGFPVVRRVDHEQRFDFAPDRRFRRAGHLVLDAAVHVQRHVEILHQVTGGRAGRPGTGRTRPAGRRRRRRRRAATAARGTGGRDHCGRGDAGRGGQRARVRPVARDHRLVVARSGVQSHRVRTTTRDCEIVR